LVETTFEVYSGAFVDLAAGKGNEPRERFFSLSFFGGMLLVLLLLVAIFHPLLFGGKIPGDLDNLFFFYPQRALIHDGQGTFWNPYQFSGYAEYRDPVLSLFYPPSWAYRFFPLRGTYIANILGHYLYAAAGFLWLGYLLGLPRVVRLAGALSFCFGGYLLGKFLNHSLLVTATHAPWVFGAFYRGLELRSFRWMAVASIFLALQILSGIPHTVVFMLMALGAYTVTVAALERSRYPLWAGALCVMLALGLSAVQLAPTFAGIRQGVRVTQDLSTAAEGQLPFNWVPEFILGGTDRAKEDINEYLETTCYPGVAMVLLLPFAFWGSRKRLPIFLMALFLGTVLLALGAQTFAYRTFFRLPGGNLFNIPGRFLFLASWSVPIVGMLGMARLMEKRPGDRRIDQLLWTLLGLGILLIVFPERSS
jgi:hypothetical protein